MQANLCLKKKKKKLFHKIAVSLQEVLRVQSLQPCLPASGKPQRLGLLLPGLRWGLREGGQLCTNHPCPVPETGIHHTPTHTHTPGPEHALTHPAPGPRRAGAHAHTHACTHTLPRPSVSAGAAHTALGASAHCSSPADTQDSEGASRRLSQLDSGQG